MVSFFRCWLITGRFFCVLREGCLNQLTILTELTGLQQPDEAAGWAQPAR